jgi:hypothetical protein
LASIPNENPVDRTPATDKQRVFKQVAGILVVEDGSHPHGLDVATVKGGVSRIPTNPHHAAVVFDGQAQQFDEVQCPWQVPAVSI